MKKFTRVLIVDDENIFRSTLRNLIPWEDEGFFIVGFAENGQQAISLLDATMPQIVITDIAMPIMNGVDLLTEINRRNALLENKSHRIETIVISGFDTFSYVRDAMKQGAFDYILKSELNSAALLQRLNNLVACLPDFNQTPVQLEFSHFFSNLLNQNYSNIDFIQQELYKYRLTLDLTQPLFFVKSFCSDTSEEYIQPKDARRILLHQLKELPVAVFLYQQACIILGNVSALHSTLNILQQYAEYFPSLYWGVYQNFPHLQECGKILLELEQIPQQFFYAPNKKVFYFKPDLVFSMPNCTDTNFIVNATTKSDFQSILSYLGEFLARSFQTKTSPYALRKYCEQVVYAILFVVEKSCSNLPSLNQKKIEYFQKIDSTATIDELCDVLDNILSDIFSLNTPPMENAAALIHSIDQYLDQNYMLPLRLSDVADHVHISYYHLSRIMNAHYQEPFNDYLNRIRINAAQNLIRNTSLPIGRIAEDVGFANQSYFGKIFKKQLGISPRLYRLQGTKDTPNY